MKSEFKVGDIVYMKPIDEIILSMDALHFRHELRDDGYVFRVDESFYTNSENLWALLQSSWYDSWVKNKKPINVDKVDTVTMSPRAGGEIKLPYIVAEIEACVFKTLVAAWVSSSPEPLVKL